MGRRLDKAVTRIDYLAATLGYSALGVLLIAIALVQMVCHMSITIMIMSVASIAAGWQLITYGVREYNHAQDNN